MNLNRNQLFAVFAAIALVISGVGMAMAAPGSIDSSATDTSEITHIADGKTIDTTFNASGNEKYGLPVLNSTTSDLAMNVTKNGTEYYSFNGTWNAYDSGETDTSDDYIHNFSDSDLSRVPMAINEKVTLNVTYWDPTATSPTPTTVQVHIENTDERSVHSVTESAAYVELNEKSPPIYRPFSDDYTAVNVDDTVSVNGSTTNVIYTLDESTVQNPFANRTESLEAGAFTLTKAELNAGSNEKVPVFLNSAPDWYDAAEMGSYAIYDSKSNTVTFETAGENFEGATSSDVSLSSDVYRVSDLGTVWNLAGGFSGSGVDAVVDMVL